MPDALVTAREEAEAEGATPVLVGWDGAARAVLVVADTVKPSSAEAVAGLRDLGLHPVLLTGDNVRAARTVAAEVGIDEVVAEVLPAEKVDVVRRLQGEGRVVAVVGDGVNDAAALAQADLGLAMGTGTDVAIEASDLTLVRGDLRAAVDAIRLARRTLSTIKGNLFWAFAYNVAALPARRLGPAQPHDRRGRHGLQQRARGHQQPPPPPLPVLVLLLDHRGLTPPRPQPGAASGSRSARPRPAAPRAIAAAGRCGTGRRRVRPRSPGARRGRCRRSACPTSPAPRCPTGRSTPTCSPAGRRSRPRTTVPCGWSTS